jgi:dTDP-glucose 4,6-dehydratase
VYDACNALFHIIDEAAPNEIYNVTAKQEFVNLEVVQIICNALEKGHHLIKHVEDRLGHDFRYSMTNDKIKALGWTPLYKFRDGIQQTCQWYISNQYILNM